MTESISSLIKNNLGISIELVSNKKSFQFCLDGVIYGNLEVLTKAAFQTYINELQALADSMK